MESDPHRENPALPRGTRSGLGVIVYISKAARPVSHDDLNHLLEHARRRNVQEGITGVLLYADGSFLQYLEGPADGLLRVYATIKAHPLHFGLIDLVREPVREREFAEWAMACHWVGTAGTSPLTHDYELLHGRMTAAVQHRSAASTLLSKFYTQGRSAVAPALLHHSQARLQRRMAAGIFDEASD
jgi:hypothetical protein